MGVVRNVGIRVVLGVTQAEVALVAGPAAVRVYAEQVVQQKFEQSFSSGPADGRASTAWTNGGFSEEKHGPLLSVWPGREVYTRSGTLELGEESLVGVGCVQQPAAISQEGQFAEPEDAMCSF